jgi:hypothetical protein
MFQGQGWSELKLRTNVYFDSVLPDGAIEDEHDFVVWPAGPVTEALRDLLIGIGCDADPVVSVEFKGWEFVFTYRGRRMWCRATMIERYLAMFEDLPLWPRLVGGRHRLYVELLTRLHEALLNDARFSKLRWCASNEVETDIEGALHPVS